jgi:aldehyde dehydrogenase (NAD+)
VPAPKRAEILYRAAHILTERKETYAREMTREMGKILDETRGDVQEAIDMSYLMAGEGRRMFGQTAPSELRDKFAMSLRQPIGVCGLITAWNFPIAVPSWKILPALVCGNTVVFKPAEEAPQSAVNFVRALTDAGIPRGVLNLVLGDGPGAGAPLVSHPDVQVVSFTGSTDVGRIVNQACAPTFKKVHLEMGGKNVILVMDDAKIDLAVEGALWGGFGTTGQRCTAASRVVVHEKVYRAFLDAFVARARALRVGDGLKPETQMGPSVSEPQLQRVMDYVRIGQDEGARIATGGHRLTQGDLQRGYFHEPTVFADAAPSMRIAREEIFGPVVSVVPCRSLDEGIAIANDVAYGLSASIYTQDVNRAFAAMRDSETGIFYVNAPTIGAEVHLPFGGLKATGSGHREAGTAALDVFSEWKSVYVDFSGKLQRAQIDTADL